MTITDEEADRIIYGPKPKPKVPPREERKKEWEEWCEERRNKDTPMQRYCRLIRGIRADFELTFEEHEKVCEEGDKIRTEMRNEEIQRRRTRNAQEDIIKGRKDIPEGMTKTAWLKQMRRQRREEKEELKQQQADWEFSLRRSPLRLLEKELDGISCKCEGELMRRGEFCETCKLIVMVHKYMLGLFKDVAEENK